MFDHVRRAVDFDDHPLLEVFGGDHGFARSLGVQIIESSTRVLFASKTGPLMLLARQAGVKERTNRPTP